LRRPALHLQIAALLSRARKSGCDEGRRALVPCRAARLRARADRGLRRRRERHRARRLGGLRRRGRERASARPCDRRLWLPLGGRGGRRPGDRSLHTLPNMIDLRAARNDPERFRAALARRGAAVTFDELLAADERWRSLVPQVDELRGQQKGGGKPTPEQIEEMKHVKVRLKALEDELAAAEAERDGLLVRVPNLPHESV